MPRSPAMAETRPPPRVWAFGAEAAEAQVCRRMEAVHRLGADTREIARALRQARKAALASWGAYDPVGHAALVRLSKAGPRAAGHPSVFGKR